MKRLVALIAVLAVASVALLPAAANAFITCPDITTLPATSVNDDWATFNARISIPGAGYNGTEDGIVLTGGQNCLIYFQYGTSPGVYTKTTSSLGLAEGKFLYSIIVRALDPCTTYYVRAVVYCPVGPVLYPHGENGMLTALLSGNSNSLSGLGVGVNMLDLGNRLSTSRESCTAYGNEVRFTTSGCKVVPGQANAGTSGGTASGPTPVRLASISVQSATIATPKVGPGQQVDITASIANTGAVNGDAKITLYVNGQEETSQGITVASGQTAPLHFYVTRNEPGTYSVYVGGTNAGSFTVDYFNTNDILIYGAIALVTLGLAGVIYMVTRKRTA